MMQIGSVRRRSSGTPTQVVPLKTILQAKQFSSLNPALQPESSESAIGTASRLKSASPVFRAGFFV
jgi:hypothetical protein